MLVVGKNRPLDYIACLIVFLFEYSFIFLWNLLVINMFQDFQFIFLNFLSLNIAYIWWDDVGLQCMLVYLFTGS